MFLYIYYSYKTPPVAMKDVLPNFTSALHTEYDASCPGLG